MAYDKELFRNILSFDSTSGKEQELAEWLHGHLEAPSKELMEVGDGTLNLFLRWGTPRVVFCTHMDTVPPYIAPTYEDSVWRGRGTCDAKGQLISMYTACRQLEAAGCTGFGLLLLAGEETGSWGAKAFSKTGFKAPYLIVGEPTENKMVSASKGTKSYDLVFRGTAFHSGYPQYGLSAVDLFNEFYNKLKNTHFPVDPELGETTWNVGLLHSDNPQNILSPELTCRIYFRTTFASDALVEEKMRFLDFARNDSLVISTERSEWRNLVRITPRGGDTPAKYLTLPGFYSAPVAFGSDAPHLTGFEHKAICGPGTIRVAHRDDEFITEADIDTAVSQYIQMFHTI
ncbi:MAG: M20/M25/M40 family metallo-hydrolase [Bacteroidales bacterium]|nr:M20/M25/M40 family metallo-hydrolase [Bacteroidales bacterium]